MSRLVHIPVVQVICTVTRQINSLVVVVMVVMMKVMGVRMVEVVEVVCWRKILEAGDGVRILNNSFLTNVPCESSFQSKFFHCGLWAALVTLFPGINKSINNLEVSCVQLLFMFFMLLPLQAGPPSLKDPRISPC